MCFAGPSMGNSADVARLGLHCLYPKLITGLMFTSMGIRQAYGFYLTVKNKLFNLKAKLSM